MNMTKNYTLYPWQEDAVSSFVAAQHGIIEAFTGSGKSLIAIESYIRLKQNAPALQLVIVVPTTHLAQQWKQTLIRKTNISSLKIGLLGGGHSDSLNSHPILIAVINSAYKILPQQSHLISNSIFLVVDECHRSGSPEFQKIFQMRRDYCLGLSATPEREEYDENGLKVQMADQTISREIGPICYQFSIKKGREMDWLPDFMLYHHGLSMNDNELEKYERYTKTIKKAISFLKGIIPINKAKDYVNDPHIGHEAKKFVEATLGRKQLLFQVNSRLSTTLKLIIDTIQDKPEARIIIFNERQDMCESIYHHLIRSIEEQCLPLSPEQIAIEHSALPKEARRLALSKFRSGAVKILCSVKTLIEGIDVPEADVGIAMAFTSSIRQRIQTCGRVLRRSFDPNIKKSAQMHFLYVSNTVDTRIYEEEDWHDLIGEENNRYFEWSEDGRVIPVAYPPRNPKKREDTIAQELSKDNHFPQLWEGMLPSTTFKINSYGILQTLSSHPIANPQGVPELFKSIMDSPCGRIYISEKYRYVIVKKEHQLIVIGQLQEPFKRHSTEKSSTKLKHQFNAPFLGSTDQYFGVWKNISRGIRLDKLNKKNYKAQHFMRPIDQSTNNIQHLRQMLNMLNPNGQEFYINQNRVAWYSDSNGQARFIAVIHGEISVQNLSQSFFQMEHV